MRIVLFEYKCALSEFQSDKKGMLYGESMGLDSRLFGSLNNNVAWFELLSLLSSPHSQIHNGHTEVIEMQRYISTSVQSPEKMTVEL